MCTLLCLVVLIVSHSLRLEGEVREKRWENRGRGWKKRKGMKEQCPLFYLHVSHVLRGREKEKRERDLLDILSQCEWTQASHLPHCIIWRRKREGKRGVGRGRMGSKQTGNTSTKCVPWSQNHYPNNIHHKLDKYCLEREGGGGERERERKRESTHVHVHNLVHVQ